MQDPTYGNKIPFNFLFILRMSKFYFVKKLTKV